MKYITHYLSALLLFASLPLFADNNADAQQKAIALLNNPVALEQYISQHAEAQAADQKVQNLAGNSQNKAQIYQLASEIFASLLQQYNGDPNALMQAMAQAQSNPEAFANSLSPDQKQKIKRIALDIEQARR